MRKGRKSKHSIQVTSTGTWKGRNEERKENEAQHTSDKYRDMERKK